MKNKATFDRTAIGRRYFAKEDGKVYTTVPTGVYDSKGKMTYVDRMVSTSEIDACAALTATEYKLIDSVVNDERNNSARFSTWLRSLTNNIVNIDGMKWKTYWYSTVTGNTVSRSTMDLEDDSPNTTISIEEDGVPLPLEFADWQSNIRVDPTASSAAGFDVSAEKARAAAEGVARGLDLRQINGWGGLKYKTLSCYGWRDVPTTLEVAQHGDNGGAGWLDSTTSTTEIYDDIVSMVRLLNDNKVPGPYVLTLPESFRFRLAESYHTNSVTDAEKSLWFKILEKPSKEIPNVLNISEIRLVPEMDELAGGGTPTVGEAYVSSLDKRWFRVLNYLAMQSFTIALKGDIATKHRVVEGLCPLFKKNTSGTYGFVKLTAPDGSNS